MMIVIYKQLAALVCIGRCFSPASPVPLMVTCAGALISGVRSRLDFFEPYVVDEFERRFRAQ